ncbi:hypothetical protein ES332_A04G192500v1 [Gossypium tomentosum]|uniref:Transmembrane protein n=1 Tax=Gossypium tomentosum TaxID=34277 RepID=A0A5D2R485_GOSTO|nr:hypothetical protein ES332_A04G192500v1 [Gossypium tomentosum]
MNTPSARHKSGCKYKKSKCLKYSMLLMLLPISFFIFKNLYSRSMCNIHLDIDMLYDSPRCHCEDCDNSFGNNSESMFQRVEKQQNQSHEMLYTAQVMSDSTLAWTANSFSSMWEKLV